MFSRNPNLRINDFCFRKFFFWFLLKQGIEIKYVAKTVYFHKEKYVTAPLKEIKTFFVKKTIFGFVASEFVKICYE